MDTLLIVRLVCTFVLVYLIIRQPYFYTACLYLLVLLGVR